MGFFKKEKEILVWNSIGKWVFRDYKNGPIVERNTCIFKIYYKPKVDEYHLVTEGYDPNRHTEYATALDKLMEFETRGFVDIIREGVLKELRKQYKENPDEVISILSES